MPLLLARALRRLHKIRVEIFLEINFDSGVDWKDIRMDMTDLLRVTQQVKKRAQVIVSNL